MSPLASAIALASSTRPSVRTDSGCYLVGQTVTVAGRGFAPSRTFDVAIDGVDFGQSKTSSSGGFSVKLIPGGLGPGIVQSIDQLNATDGSGSADTTFTLSRSLGARFLITSGNPDTLRSRFQVWGFGQDGAVRTAYLHYVSPAGRPRRTVTLGQTAGQCGYLLTARRRVFPFVPSKGTWTLQVDASRSYAPHPMWPVTRIRVRIG